MVLENKIRWEVSFAGESVVRLVLRFYQCFKYAYVLFLSFVCFYQLLSRGRCSWPEVFCKTGDLKNFSKLTGLRSQACNFIKIEILAQVFSTKF